MLATILLIVAGIIALPLIIALFLRKEYNSQAEIIINSPSEKVFEYLKHLKNQDNFNKWVMVDPGMKRNFIGTDGTVGFIYSWNGNKKAGEGEQEIKKITEGKNIETEVRFVRPMAAVAYASYIIESLPNNQTKVTYSNKGKMTYPMNIMTSMVEKMLTKDMSITLSSLKTILEK